jgi:hypothetical protein
VGLGGEESTDIAVSGTVVMQLKPGRRKGSGHRFG